jgi:hypothetical protein
MHEGVGNLVWVENFIDAFFGVTRSLFKEIFGDLDLDEIITK